MHTGEAIEEDGDLFGKPVVLAARIANQASGGEILVSSLVREIVESRGDLTFGASREVELKGLVGRHLLHPLLWSDRIDRDSGRARGCAMAMTDDRQQGVSAFADPEHPTGTFTAHVQFTALRGGVGVIRDGEPVAIGGPQQRRLLAALLAAQGAAVSADRLADTIWPDGAAPDGARRSVMTYVSRLRAAVGGDFVVTGPNGYQLVLGDASYDAAEFEARLAVARASSGAAAIAAYDDALRLWSGRAFGDDAIGVVVVAGGNAAGGAAAGCARGALRAADRGWPSCRGGRRSAGADRGSAVA